MNTTFWILTVLWAVLRSAVPLSGKVRDSAILYIIESIDLDAKKIVLRYMIGDHWSPAFVTFDDCTQIVSSCLKGTAGVGALQPGQQCYLDLHWEDGTLLADRILIVQKSSVLRRRPLIHKLEG